MVEACSTRGLSSEDNSGFLWVSPLIYSNLLGEELPGINVKSALEESTVLVTVQSLGLLLENSFCPMLSSVLAKFCRKLLIKLIKALF